MQLASLLPDFNELLLSMNNKEAAKTTPNLLAELLEEQAIMLHWQATRLRAHSNAQPAALAGAGTVAPAAALAATALAPVGKPKKDKKDPNKPKRAASAYQLFMQAHLNDVKKANPDLPQTTIMSKVAAMWSQVSAEDKKKYQTSADKARAVHDEVMKAYNAGKATSAPASSSAVKAKKPVAVKPVAVKPVAVKPASSTPAPVPVVAAVGTTPNQKRKHTDGETTTEQKKEKKHKKDKKEKH